MNRKIGIMFFAFVLAAGLSKGFAADEKMDAKKTSTKTSATKAADKMSAKMDEKMGGMDAEAMAKMMELAAPGENHKKLDVFAGKWKHTMKWWMTPDAPPEESAGSTTSKWILDGRFIQSDTTGTAMGQPFKGMGLMGYDNVKKEYTNLWLDNMSTGVMMATAEYDAANKTFEEKGSFYCPMIKGEKKFRAVWKIVDDDHLVYEMHSKGMDNTGDEFKVMEINYERVN